MKISYSVYFETMQFVFQTIRFSCRHLQQTLASNKHFVANTSNDVDKREYCPQLCRHNS